MKTIGEVIQTLQNLNNEPDISPPQVQTFRIPESFYLKVFENCQIPPRICVLRPSELELDKRAAPLWKNALDAKRTWKNGYSNERGLLMAGTQGAGKSTALYVLAKDCVKSWIDAPQNLHVIRHCLNVNANPQIPVVIEYFKLWVRQRFVTEHNGRITYNFDIAEEWLNKRAIFLDDVTFDSASETFRPVREFMDIFVELMTRQTKPPALFITTNNTGEEWDKLLGAQIVDRLAGKTHGICKTVKCNWESYRKG